MIICPSLCIWQPQMLKADLKLDDNAGRHSGSAHRAFKSPHKELLCAASACTQVPTHG